MTFGRWLAAFISAPIVPAIVLATFDSFATNSASWIRLFAFSLAMGYGLMTVVGIPAYLLVLRHRRITLPAALITGALVGFGPFALLLAFVTGPSIELVRALPLIGQHFLLGALGGAVAWFVAYKVPPDRPVTT